MFSYVKQGKTKVKTRCFVKMIQIKMMGRCLREHMWYKKSFLGIHQRNNCWASLNNHGTLKRFSFSLIFDVSYSDNVFPLICFTCLEFSKHNSQK